MIDNKIVFAQHRREWFVPFGGFIVFAGGGCWLSFVYLKGILSDSLTVSAIFFLCGGLTLACLGFWGAIRTVTRTVIGLQFAKGDLVLLHAFHKTTISDICAIRLNSTFTKSGKLRTVMFNAGDRHGRFVLGRDIWGDNLDVALVDIKQHMTTPIH